jgi:hypothetical protein
MYLGYDSLYHKGERNMKFKVFWLTAIVGTSIASSLPISSSTSSQTGFDSLDAAAKYAEKLAMDLSKDYEFGGALYEREGKYFFTTAVTNKNSYKVDYQISLPKGAKMIGMYHTHPDSSPYSDAFSVSDIETANRMMMTMYVGVVSKNHTLKYDPQKDHVILDRKNVSVVPFHPSAI